MALPSASRLMSAALGLGLPSFTSQAQKIVWGAVPQKEVAPTLMAITYRVEKVAFAKHMRVTALKKSYLWPWRPKDLLERVAIETAAKVSDTASAIANAVAVATVNQLKDAHLFQTDSVKTVTTVALKRGRLVDTYSLAAERRETRELQAQQVIDKETRKLLRAHKRQDRTEKEAAKQSYRLAHNSLIVGCSRVKYSGKK